MKLKIIPPRRPINYISSDEISAAEALIMLAHGRSSSSPTNHSTAAKGKTAPVSDQNPISGSTAHECFTCHKIFSSGQALGGHQTTPRKIKSSHGGSRPCNAAAAAPTSILNMISLCGKKRKHNNNYEEKLGLKMIGDSSDGINNNSGVTTSSDEAASSNTRVRLNISRPCNAAAPTSILNRISLCGKKRKHKNDYEGKLGIKMISDSSDGINNSGVTTSSDEAAASNTRVRLNIDLNLPPAPEFC